MIDPGGIRAYRQKSGLNDVGVTTTGWPERLNPFPATRSQPRRSPVNATGDAKHGNRRVPVAAQGLLFSGDLPELSEDTGYRGPTAC